MKMVEQIASDIKSMYLPENRYANFGDVLLTMEVHGIRGMSASIDFDFPITVIIGKNGSGKSTLAQLALCCYRYKLSEEVVHNSRNYYSLGSFFIKSSLDPEPYTSDAYLRYSFADNPKEKEVGQMTLFEFCSNQGCPTKDNIIRKVNSKWGGYHNRPDRKCIYFGMGFFVPHHEMGDRIYLDPKTYIYEKRSFSMEAIKRSTEILGTPYDEVEVAKIINQSKQAEMGFASRFGARYSENHMGCGEGRLIRMIDAIESAPEKSLIVIEEPETALHQDAQYKLAIYFLEVCKRKRHQIIVTTHSPAIVSVMPMEARKKTERTISGTAVENNPTIAEIISDLTNGNQKSLLVYVEDEFSKRLLIEIVRKFAPPLLKALSIAAVGDKQKVMQAVRYTRKHKDVKCIGIRDENGTACIEEFIFAYPSDDAPEKEIFCNKFVSQFLFKQYNIDFENILSHAKDHHEYADHISLRCDVDKITIEVQCIQEYVSNQDISKFAALLDNIKKHC